MKFIANNLPYINNNNFNYAATNQNGKDFKAKQPKK